MRPRLLHVFSTLAVGGSQVRTADLVSGFGDRYEHVFVAADGRTDALERLSFAAPWRLRPPTFAKGRGLAVRNLRTIARIVAEERPALLLTYNFGALEAALVNRLWTRLPHLHFEDGFGPEESPQRQLRRRIWLRRLALGARTRVVVPSRTLHEVALSVWRLPAERLAFIPNGIHLERFAPPAAVGERAEGPVRIGTVGALRAEKNLPRLVRAVAAVARDHDVELHLVGAGPDRPRLEAEIRRLGLGRCARFHGHVERPEALLASFDVFAMSSDTEQMPLTLLEAMATGLPVVATDVGDVSSLLPDAAHPFVVPPSDEETFTRALARLVTDPALRRALGRRNRLHAGEHYSFERMWDRYDRLLAEVMRVSAEP